MKNLMSRKDLQEFAREHGLRADWHEPDEEDIDAVLATGTSFDNAACDPTREFAVELYRRIEEGVEVAASARAEVSHWVELAEGRREPLAEHAVFLLHDGEPVAAINLALLLALATGTTEGLD